MLLLIHLILEIPFGVGTTLEMKKLRHRGVNLLAQGLTVGKSRRLATDPGRVSQDQWPLLSLHNVDTCTVLVCSLSETVACLHKVLQLAIHKEFFTIPLQFHLNKHE